MIKVLSGAWALLFGMMLFQLGNGMQGTLLGIRGEIEGFTTFQMSLIMSGYFVGFLFGSRMTPDMIRRVGHVRVFAALGSMISAIMLLYPTWTDPWAWWLARILIGFCFSGVYVTAESWLNNASSNENRGKALSLYMIVQMFGIVSAQGLMLVADPGGFILFIIPSVLVSIAFTPILLSISPTPAFEKTQPMTLLQIFHTSPLGCVGMFLLGGIFSAQFGMGAVYGGKAGLTVGQISGFVSAFYIGALIVQYPLGWLSDWMDRRLLILAASAGVAIGALVAMLFGEAFVILLMAAFVVGGLSNPLYSLVIAYTNDFLQREDMPAAAGGLIFINGLGAVAGPVIIGWMMEVMGPRGFFLYIAILGALMSVYAAYRMTRRPSTPAIEATDSFTNVMPSSSLVAVNMAQEYVIDVAQEEEDEDARAVAAARP